MWRAAWLMFLVACGGSSSGADASRSPPVAGTYQTADSTCSNAPLMFELSWNSDGTLSYAPCIQTTCTPDGAAMSDDGTGTFVGSGLAMNCGTDPECGCQINYVTFLGDKAVASTDGSVVVSIGRASDKLIGCSATPPSGTALTWCDVHGVLQP